MFPGFTIGEALDDRTYEAAMNVQVGLMVIRYVGRLALFELDAERRTTRFRVNGVAPGGLTLGVNVGVSVSAHGEALSRLTISNDITLDATTSLLAGAMLPVVSGMLLDGFARNLQRLLSAGPMPPQR